MDSKAFVNKARRQAGDIATYIKHDVPLMVVRKTLRFIDGNFRKQGWQGQTFQKWADKKSNKGRSRPGRVLIVTGRLRRGVNFSIGNNGEIRFYNNVKYAKIHNQGGEINAVAQVSAFTRRRFYHEEVSGPRAKKQRFKKTEIGKSEVKAHTRTIKITMKKRQFMDYEGNTSPVLSNSISKEIEKKIKKYLTI